MIVTAAGERYVRDALTAAAVDDGTVPADVAAWVADGANPDQVEWPDGVATPAREAGAWTIDGIGAAAWAMRHVRKATDELDAIDRAYKVELTRLNEWRTRARERDARTLAYMVDRLTVWALAERDRTGKATVSTPAGVVRTRAPGKPWAIDVDDKDALLAWALANGADGFTRPTTATLRDLASLVDVMEVEDGFAAYEKETGDLVPGLAVTVSASSVTVVPS